METRDPRLVFQAIVDDGGRPDVRILLAALKVCKNLKDLRTGKKIHEQVVKNKEFSTHSFVTSALVDMYAKCGRLDDAREVFEGMRCHDVVLWNCLIQGYVHGGKMELALDLYDRMRREGCNPNRGTLLAVLKATVALVEKEDGSKRREEKVAKFLERGREIHAQAMRTGNEMDSFVANSLVVMYAKCGSMEEAREFFDRMKHRDVVSWNCLVMGYARNGQGEVALEMFSRMGEQGCEANKVTFLAALKACVSLAEKEEGMVIQGRVVKSGSLERGRDIHSRASARSLEGDLFVANALIDFYSRCGSLEDAWRVFDSLDGRRDLVSWNSMIQGCARSGEADLALHLYGAMKEDGFQPNKVTVLAVLKACMSLAEKEEDPASEVPLLKEVKSAHVQRCLKQGQEIHFEAARHGYDSDVFVASTLVDMYGKCGNLAEARKVFESIKKRSVVPWTVIIMAYAHNGDGEEALRLYSRMQDEGCVSNRVTILAALKACASLAGKSTTVREFALERGRAIHRHAVEMGLHTELFVANALMDMYSRCGSMSDALNVFSSTEARDLVSWNSIIQGFTQSGDPEAALEFYSRMKDEGKCSPNRMTVLTALKACVLISEREATRTIDGKAVKVESLRRVRCIYEPGVEIDTIVANTFIDVYAKCGSMADARQVFDALAQQRTTVSWTAIINGYAENDDGEEALELFERMKSENFSPSELTFLGAFKACGSLAEKEEPTFVQDKAVKTRSLELARSLHSQAATLWSWNDPDKELDVIVANTLIDIYAKCGDLVEARRIFETLGRRKSVVSWNCMIQGYAQVGDGVVALELFDRMEATHRDRVTYLSAIRACASIGETTVATKRQNSLERGRQIHRELTAQVDEEMDISVANSLIDMYAKCGSLEESKVVFETIDRQQRTLVSWNCILLAHADNGQEEEALELYSQMKDEKYFQPDAVTFFAVLKACGNLAALETGRKICAEAGDLQTKNVMVANSIVNFFARCGSMNEAENVFKSIPSKNSGSWSALIAGYSFQGHTNRVFDLLEEMSNEKNQHVRPNSTIFLSILNACSHAGLVEKGQEVFEAMRHRYGITPGIQHYACMVDLLSRAHKLDEALAMVESMPVEPDEVVWTALLAGANKWRNVRIGRIAFDRGLEAGVANFVLMANLYASVGMWDEVQVIYKRMKEMEACRN